MTDFLLEIGLEEVPARMIAGGEAELGRRVYDLLTRERLLDSAATVITYSTPRRLAVLVEGVLAVQADTEEQLIGPSWKIGFKDGAPTPAAEAFAKKAGIAVADLQKIANPKGEYVGATIKRKGRTAADTLVADLPKEVLSIYWAKNMYWRAGKPERFVRPVRWVVALLDSAIVPVEIAGIAAGKTSRGHRVLHGAAPVVISQARAYSKCLLAASVLVDVAARRERIRKALDKATRTVPGARWREDESLVETVLHLTEWPSVILGSFESEYLSLPEEVLVTVMRDHQKYFAVEDADGRLAPHFLAVLNTETDEQGAAIIRNGNARELRARFKDAQFFWDFDQKTPLTERVESLNQVTFQKELGSYHWKTQENLAIAKKLSALVKLQGKSIEEPVILKAAELAKTDLTTELVKEFTELQGIIGGLYAQSQGLGEKTAQAISDQYRPAATEDSIPRSFEGQILGLADRIQTIVAMFRIGMAPTGSKDPFALRRAANGVVKILLEAGFIITVGELLDATAANEEIKSQVRAFLRERVQFLLKDVRGFDYDIVNAVLAVGADDVKDALARAEGVAEVRHSADFAAVSAAFKRIKNILRQAEEKGFAILAALDANRLAPQAQQLADAASVLAPQVAKLREAHAYGDALALIASLRPAVDTFFDKVMVLDPDPEIRGVNLTLIASVLDSFSGIADFSEIVTS